MNKLKTLWSILSSVLIFTTTIGCTNHLKKTQVQTDTTLVVKENEFDLFLKNQHIQALLNLIYKNDNLTKEKYIQSQKKLDINYLLKLKTALRYANNLTYSLNFNRNSFFGVNKASILETNEKLIKEFTRTNWLFYLFNFSKLVFVQDQDNRGDDANSALLAERDSENLLLYQTFYQAQNNQINDYVIQEYANDDYAQELRVFLLTQEGFIIRINIELYKEENSTPSVEIYGYINTYPKLLNSNNKNNFFSLFKYISDTKGFADENLNYSESQRVLFNDHYGGIELIYTLVDIK
ncbi:aromatic motif membrane protein [Mycoplasma sp. 1018B]|uniref:aromatic motif membrane protein n=1 Tax=Mycoplasma sp. 1018B TaxID=2967302 RepID=UPI00211CA3A1|nr:aromatic motif membrane protein [Mycoplasma sp. 1018B]UUM19392.1 hypothetical protein NPA14_00765 [Mycoplasma sp. 1018B]